MLIAEVSRKYDISADTLRYYERVGLIPAVHRRDNGIRDYDEGDLNWVEFIKCMRSAGIQVEALIEYVALYQQGDETNEARKEILVEQRAQLMQRMADMESTLERLNYKIDNYDRVMRNSIDMSKCKNSDG
ncbi:MerR family transcriptional regulator [Raoultibacter timonensis]|uniref:MerR family transcriptional regulator n=1 Tax=Raoultibacter timonensis TaxID=1907662 RepID=A0ABM7WJG3_9ACTN|nr:MerR family transcriptional regulator [Raoultibacter timonensis]BDE96471.1 MerR family transcriptional regulator [Raoultibacter timonensis]BDF51074.1 MerR family transcriptional regulator [Raoultibacter timonensis]